MDFIDEVRTRSGRFANRTEHLDTEEATKSALVLPFMTETQGGQEVSTTTETEGAGEPSTTTDTRPPDPNRPITKAPDPGSVEDREQK